MEHSYPSHMKHQSTGQLLLQLEDLLEWERKSLVQGDLDAVVRILSEKERMIESLATIDPDHKNQFNTVYLKAERNQELLKSALEGIRAATERISVIQKIRTTLETYDRNGQKTTVGSFVHQQIEKRA